MMSAILWRPPDLVEIGNGAQGLGRGGVAKPVGQGVAPGRVFGWQGEQFRDGFRIDTLLPGIPILRCSAKDRDYPWLTTVSSSQR
jgi:hypothetical protein